MRLTAAALPSDHWEYVLAMSPERALMICAFEQELEGARFENLKMPVNQMNDLHLRAAQFPNLLRFKTAKDFEDWTTRLRHLPKQFEDTIAAMPQCRRSRPPSPAAWSSCAGRCWPRFGMTSSRPTSASPGS